MKNVLLAAVLLAVAGSAQALDGVSCHAAGNGAALDEATAMTLVRGRGEGLKIAAPDHTPGVEWQAAEGPFRLAMYWTPTCILFVESSYGITTNSAPYECDDASLEWLKVRGTGGERLGMTTCQAGGRVDHLTVKGLGDTTTEQLLDAMYGAGTIARLGRRDVVVSYSHGLYVFLPGYETLGLETPLFVHRTGPQWREYDLTPFGLPRIVALFEYYGRGPGTATIWTLP